MNVRHRFEFVIELGEGMLTVTEWECMRDTLLRELNTFLQESDYVTDYLQEETNLEILSIYAQEA
jgi:hypothetical protein